MNACYVRETFPPAPIPAVHERLLAAGAEGLRDGELLSLALCLSEDKLKPHLGDKSIADLLTLPYEQLASCFGQRSATLLLCALELAKRLLNKGIGIVPAISCPVDALPYLTGIRDQRKEHFLCLYLNARNQLIQLETVSIGSLAASIVHPREVFQTAVGKPCASIILAHNHPSGDSTPSTEDIELTRRLTKAGEILGIEVLDHIVVCHSDYLSFKEKGLF